MLLPLKADKDKITVSLKEMQYYPALKMTQGTGRPLLGS
jgi:hypothetical protein